MYIRSLLTLFLSITLAVGAAQNSNFNCSKFSAGCFLEIKDKEKDTLILFRGLEYWIEASVKRHECRVCKINWTNSCNFSLQYTNFIHQYRLPPTYDQFEHEYYNGDVSAISSDSKSIKYKKKLERSLIFIDTITLKPIKDTDSWKYLVDADTLLYSDSSEIKKLYGLPERNYFDNVPDFINLITDTAETRFAQYIFSLLEMGDIRPAYTFASAVLRRNSNDTILNDYNEYIQHAFGRLLSYQVISMDEKYAGMKKVPPLDNFIFAAQFTKIKAKVKVVLSIARGAAYPLMTLNVVADSAIQVTFMDSLTSGFRMLLKNHDFRDIYYNSSIVLQSKVTYQDAEKTLTEIYNRGNIDSYKLFFQTFSVAAKKGSIVAGYKCKINGKTDRINLNYTLEDGKYKLAGLNANEN